MQKLELVRRLVAAGKTPKGVRDIAAIALGGIATRVADAETAKMQAFAVVAVATEYDDDPFNNVRFQWTSGKQCALDEALKFIEEP